MEDHHEDEDEEEHSKWWVKIRQARGGEVEVHRFLMCKGVEWGFQYHNFYGDWELSMTEPMCNGRPHYVHTTMYGGHAHLFHTIDPHYHVPRWVIGPAPGNENGWAFCASDAPTPHEVQATWISWDGFEWHSCKSFRYVPKEHEMDGLSDEEDFDMDEDEGWQDGDQFGSLLSSLDENDDAEEGNRTQVKMSLEEFEEMKTNRQMERGGSVADPAPSKPEHDFTPIAEEDSPSTPQDSGRGPADADDGKGKGKKGKKEKAEKKGGGGLFKKKK